MQGALTFRLKPSRRIGRASRVEYNPSRGSGGSIAEYNYQCKRAFELEVPPFFLRLPCTVTCLDKDWAKDEIEAARRTGNH